MTLTWTAATRTHFGRKIQIDLTLGCFWECTDGSFGTVSRASSPADDRANETTLIWMDDQRTTSDVQGCDRVFINIGRLAEIRRLVLFAHAASSHVSWGRARAAVRIEHPDVDDLNLALPDGRHPICAIALLGRFGNQLVVQTEMQFMRTVDEFSLAYSCPLADMTPDHEGDQEKPVHQVDPAVTTTGSESDRAHQRQSDSRRNQAPHLRTGAEQLNGDAPFGRLAAVRPPLADDDHLSPVDLTALGRSARVERPTSTTSQPSLTAAAAIVHVLGRQDISVGTSFARSPVGTVSPLASLYAIGERTGVVAIKLYLALLWQCAAIPYSTDKPARTWAILLDLHDPSGRGARTVNSAMRALAARNLITITAQPGDANLISLLGVAGTSRRYGRVSSIDVNREQARRDSHSHFSVASELWTEGWIQQMSGPAIVILLILLSDDGRHGGELRTSPDVFAERFNISDETRSIGAVELRTMRLPTIRRLALTTYPGESEPDSPHDPVDLAREQPHENEPRIRQATSGSH